jgi:hypothetical protein
MQKIIWKKSAFSDDYIKLIEKTLSDLSLSYEIQLGNTTIECDDENSAKRMIDVLTSGHYFIYW